MLKWLQRRARIREWRRVFVDTIVTFYGETSRFAAENAADDYLDRQSIEDDPTAAAVLTMEGWSYA